MTLKRAVFLLGFVLLLAVAPIAYQIDRAAQSLPQMDGEIQLPGLREPATIRFDARGIAEIQAASRLDAYRLLGFLHARDRLFQMDLLRRRMTGRLAEVLGQPAAAADRRQRLYGFDRVALQAVARLPAHQRAVLDAYTAGVNAVIDTAREFPPEFRLLHYRPARWAPADSLLIGASMFQTLTDTEAEERMLTLMQACLPAAVAGFLTPDTDAFDRTLAGGERSRRPERSVPTEAIAALLADPRRQSQQVSAVGTDDFTLGSNNWTVSGSKTADGCAILADDMHLPLGVPNLWYRAHLRYANHRLDGLTIPGLPLLVAGGNGHVAWGFTNLNADVLDLIRLETHPDHPEAYRTPEGWQPFDVATEALEIRDAPAEQLTIRRTLWGPVPERPLLGAPVALRWTALDPAAINLELLDIDRAETLDAAMRLFNRFGAPPQNVVLADERGQIAWTLTGLLPERRGFDGATSQNWAATGAGWSGYLAPASLPRLLNPPEGYIATANNRTVGGDYPHSLGHNPANGYRAFRIRQRLAEQPRLDERDLHSLQLDMRGGFYEFYRLLALSLLPETASLSPEAREVRAAIAGWDGQLAPDSRGIALLVHWRSVLAQALIDPLVARCRQADPDFVYQWRQLDTPLQALIRQGLPQLASARGQPDWNAYLRAMLLDSARELKQRHRVDTLAQLPWRHVNAVRIQHPFSRAQPWAGSLLDMPTIPGACNSNCVKVLHERNGASERLVLSPNHPEAASLQMPGGQSGHPLSPHYRDQQADWADGQMSAFLPGPTQHQLHLLPP